MVYYGMMDGYYGYGMMGGYGYGWIIFCWVFGLLVIVGLVLFIIWMTKKIQNESQQPNELKGGKNEKRK